MANQLIYLFAVLFSDMLQYVFIGVLGWLLLDTVTAEIKRRVDIDSIVEKLVSQIKQRTDSDFTECSKTEEIAQ